MEFELTDNIKEINGVKCRQIRYSNGKIGGFIENRSNLSGDALILENAVVSENAVVRGSAVVSGSALVRESAEVSGNAVVGGNALVYGNARINGDARVFCNCDYMTVHGLGSVNRTTTFYKNSQNGIGVSCGCFTGTLDEFREKVRKTHGDSKYAKEYLMAADLAEYHLAQ